MCTFILKSYRSGIVYNMPHFFILNKGNNSGKPLLSPCPNCFVIQFKSEEEKEHIYWLSYSLWQSKAFYQLLRGSVIPFVVLRDVKSCLLGGLNKVAENPAQFEKAVEALEKNYKQNLLLISNAKRMLFTSTFHKTSCVVLVTTGGKTRITFFGLGGTAPKVISRFPSDGCNQ